MSFLMVGKKSIIVIYFLVTVLLQIIFSSYCFVTVNLAISVTVTVNRNHTGPTPPYYVGQPYSAISA